jgi:hypothetical protein
MKVNRRLLYKARDRRRQDDAELRRRAVGESGRSIICRVGPWYYHAVEGRRGMLNVVETFATFNAAMDAAIKTGW